MILYDTKNSWQTFSKCVLPSSYKLLYVYLAFVYHLEIWCGTYKKMQPMIKVNNGIKTTTKFYTHTVNTSCIMHDVLFFPSSVLCTRVQSVTHLFQFNARTFPKARKITDINLTCAVFYTFIVL